MPEKIKSKNPEQIRFIVGLGNPGNEYKNTFHNIGSLAVDYLTKENLNFRRSPKTKNFEYLKANNLIFVRPLTFMNESGIAVRQALQYFKIKPVEILIIHDDSDIELGKYKLSFGRGSAGHKGIESIIKNLKTKNFWRLRLGVKTTGQKIKAGALVLKKISAPTQKIFQKVFEEVNKNIISQNSKLA